MNDHPVVLWMIARNFSLRSFSDAASRSYTVINRTGSEPDFQEAISRVHTVINRAGSLPLFEESNFCFFIFCNA